jgi:hypothetical protein
MAKRKNSTALFEVMAAHRARTAARSTPGESSPATPTRAAATATRASAAPVPGASYKVIEKPGIFSLGKQWLATMLEKRVRAASAPAPVAAPTEAHDPNDPTAGITAQSLASRKSATAVAEATSAGDEISSVETGNGSPSTGPVTYTTVMPTYGRSTDISEESTRGSKNQVAFDRDKHQVTLKVRFNTAVISLVALLVVVGAAYIIGKRAGKPSSAAASPVPAQQPTPQAKAPAGGPLDVSPKAAQPRSPKSNELQPLPDRVARNNGAQPAAPGGPGTGQLTPNGIFEDAPIDSGVARRAIGLNYCVISRYRPEQQEMAIDVSDFLNQHGVRNTIESVSPKLSGPTDGYVIVGTRGFSKGFSQDPAFKDYIESISRTVSQLPKKIKFTPQTEMRKWTE